MLMQETFSRNSWVPDTRVPWTLIQFHTRDLEVKTGHLEQGKNEYIELDFSSHSQMLFVCTFAMFWVGRIIQDRA